MENKTNDLVRKTTDAISESANLTPQDFAIIKAKTDRKMFIKALDEGILACLPNKEGFADTTPATNIVNNTNYHGINMLLLKAHQKENNYPTAEYLTFDSLEKVNNKLNLSFNDKVKIKKGEKGFSIIYKDMNSVEPKTYKVFNIAQTTNPEKIKEYCIIAKHEKIENDKAYFKTQGRDYKPYSKKQNETVIEVSSSKPVEYIGEYLAAVASGAKFKASPEIAQDFIKQTKDQVFEKKFDLNSQEGTINPFNLNIISSKANAYCKDFLKAKSLDLKIEKQTNQKNCKQNNDYGVKHEY